MADSDKVYGLNCVVRQVRFKRDIFAICECSTTDTIPPEAMSGFDMKAAERRFIALGDGLCADIGRKIILDGQWEQNAKYGGLQLRITDCADYVGTSKEEIIAYLSSSILCGVGKKTAETIYERFGNAALDIIENNPHALLDIPGIKEKKLQKILASYEKNKELHSLTRLLAPHDVPYRTIVRIARSLGSGAAAQIRANPYVLCAVSFFGFKKADAVALKIGDFRNSPLRIAGAVQYVLSEAQNSGGHLYLPWEALATKCCGEDVLNNGNTAKTISLEDVNAVITSMLEKGEIAGIHPDGTPDWQKTCIYTKDAYQHEHTAAELIAEKLRTARQHIPVQDWEEIVATTQSELCVQLDEKQEAGAIMALSSPISIITGGPGTGKTTGLRVVVTSFQKTYPDKTVCLAAPTGRAARRMAEQTGLAASTLHSLLGLKPDTHTDFKAETTIDDMVAADFLVVDEASMIDAHLLAELMYRLDARTQLLFLGDADQLPSVGAGNVLRQLLACPLIPHTKLERIFRQADGSIIPRNAANIKVGRDDIIQNQFFKIIPCANEEAGANAIIELQKKCMAKGMLDSTQILCPMKHRGATGTVNINAALQDIVNPPAPEKAQVHIGTDLFRVGDKVMQTRNIEDVSNGDIGYITDICGNENDHASISIVVKFDSCDVPVEFDYEGAMDLEHANAITIHKSQGSEFMAVIIPIFRSMAFFLKRNLLYTAVTRAKTQVVIVTDSEMAGISIAIRQEDTSKRNTLLAKTIMHYTQILATKRRAERFVFETDDE